MAKQKPRPRKHDQGRLTADLVSSRAVERELNISERTLHRYLKDGLPVVRRGRGRALSFFRMEDVRKWVAARRGAGEEDPGLLDPEQTSPALEKWRLERFREAKRRNDIAEGKLFPIDTIREALQKVFGDLRREFEDVGRAHGPLIADEIAGAIDRAEQATTRKFPESTATAPDPAPIQPIPPAPEVEKPGEIKTP